MKKRKPFAVWRAQGYLPGGDKHEFKTASSFDECVVSLSETQCVHIEALNERDLYVGIGDITLNVHVDKDGAVEVLIVDGFVENRDGGTYLKPGRP